ncbi:MAG TPA: formyltransferase family protein [Blastocatellia bacterium]|nr:formyltransferase family protein [Blastocatellia bacterium]
MKTAAEKLRVIILTHGGAEALLRRLLALDEVIIAGVFIETEVNRRAYTLREKLERSIRYDGYAATAAKLLRRFFRRAAPDESETVRIGQAQQRLCEMAARHNVPVQYVTNYHSASAIATMRRAEADLGIIWGTNILKEPVFSIPRLGSINLHQGLAPYYRGGPPVFWELFNDESEVGITVHFVAPKVDTGDIIVQQRVPLAYDYSYGLDYERFIADFRARMAERCAQAMTEAVRMIATGTAEPVRQDISLGQRYRLPVKREKDEMRRRLRERARTRQKLIHNTVQGTGEAQ